jgi:hypothetical protein
MLNLTDSNALLSNLLNSAKPFLVSRLGIVESNILAQTAMFHGDSFFTLKARKEAWVNAGIFPPTRDSLLKFSKSYFDALGNSDALVSWPRDVQPNHDLVAATLHEKIPRLQMSILDVLQCATQLRDIPIWTHYLQGKRVLVIHPFTKSFQLQFPKISHIHGDKLIPNFEPTFIAPPQSNGISGFTNTYEKGLKRFIEQLSVLVEKKKFDFALVAAGAYGLPVSSFLKESGIGTIYVGGTLQLYFGVSGERWRNRADYLEAKNEFWLEHPLEKPPNGAFFIEGKTYW